MSPKTQKYLEIGGLAVGVISLLYMILHKPGGGTVGATAPVLLGSGGDTSVPGLDTSAPGQSAATGGEGPLPTIPPVTIGGSTWNFPALVNNLLSPLSGGGNGGCCGQMPASVAPIAAPPVAQPPVQTFENVSEAYPNSSGAYIDTGFLS